MKTFTYWSLALAVMIPKFIVDGMLIVQLRGFHQYLFTVATMVASTAIIKWLLENYRREQHND